MVIGQGGARRPSLISRRMFIGTSFSVVGLVAVAAIRRFIAGALPEGSMLMRFASVVWRQETSIESDAGGISVRQKMLGDLVENVLPGRSRAYIESILGPSLDTSYFRHTGRDLMYVLGPERNSYFAIDEEWLLIWLDARGRFERYAIVTD
jgi:hypothetical protein